MLIQLLINNNTHTAKSHSNTNSDIAPRINVISPPQDETTTQTTMIVSIGVYKSIPSETIPTSKQLYWF